MEPCYDGLEVMSQNAYPTADLDILGAVDWLFRGGMDHHTLMTGSRTLNAVANRIVRQLSGLGRLPMPRLPQPTTAPPPTAAVADADDPTTPPGLLGHPPASGSPRAEDLEVAVAVIGAGPAGLAAAAAIADAGLDTALFDEQAHPGGSLLADPDGGPETAASLLSRASAAGVGIHGGMSAIGFYPEDPNPVLAVVGREHIYRVRARHYIYATGGYASNLPFADNDRPGVMAARAIGRLLVQYNMRAADRICLIGSGPYPQSLAAALERAGSEVLTVDPAHSNIIAIHGRTQVEAVELRDVDGAETRHECDVVAVWTAPSPASEAPRQHGCEVVFDDARGGFAVKTDAGRLGQTNIADVSVCGDVCGFMGPRRAAEMGTAVGRRVAAEVGS